MWSDVSPDSSLFNNILQELVIILSWSQKQLNPPGNSANWASCLEREKQPCGSVFCSIQYLNLCRPPSLTYLPTPFSCPQVHCCFLYLNEVVCLSGRTGSLGSHWTTEVELARMCWVGSERRMSINKQINRKKERRMSIIRSASRAQSHPCRGWACSPSQHKILTRENLARESEILIDAHKDLEPMKAPYLIHLPFLPLDVSSNLGLKGPTSYQFLFYQRHGPHAENPSHCLVIPTASCPL